MIRHGQTVFNFDDRHQGWGPVSLSEKGFSQADNARKNVENIQFDKIYASDLLRTRQTAERIFPEKYRNGEIIFTEDLREIDTGVFYGKTFDEVYPRYGETYVDCRRRMDFGPLGGESSLTVVKRAALFLKKMELLSISLNENSPENEKSIQFDSRIDDNSAENSPSSQHLSMKSAQADRKTLENSLTPFDSLIKSENICEKAAENSLNSRDLLIKSENICEKQTNNPLLLSDSTTKSENLREKTVEESSLYAKQANRDDEQDCVNEKKIAVVTHGGVIRAAATYILGFPQDYPFGFVTIKIANCSVSVFQLNETSHEWWIETLNCTGKLN